MPLNMTQQTRPQQLSQTHSNNFCVGDATTVPTNRNIVELCSGEDEDEDEGQLLQYPRTVQFLSSLPTVCNS
jgi:hypothetical protein